MRLKALRFGKVNIFHLHYYPERQLSSVCSDNCCWYIYYTLVTCQGRCCKEIYFRVSCIRDEVHVFVLTCNSHVVYTTCVTQIFSEGTCMFISLLKLTCNRYHQSRGNNFFKLIKFALVKGKHLCIVCNNEQRRRGSHVLRWECRISITNFPKHKSNRSPFSAKRISGNNILTYSVDDTSSR